MTSDRTARRVAPTVAAPVVDARAARLAAQQAASSSRDPELVAVAFGVSIEVALELARVAGAAGIRVCELVRWLRGTRSAADHSPVALAISRFRGGHCGAHAPSFLLSPRRVFKDVILGGA